MRNAGRVVLPDGPSRRRRSAKVHPNRFPPDWCNGLERRVWERRHGRGVHEALAWARQQPWFPRVTDQWPYSVSKYWFWCLNPAGSARRSRPAKAAKAATR